MGRVIQKFEGRGEFQVQSLGSPISVVSLSGPSRPDSEPDHRPAKCDLELKSAVQVINCDRDLDSCDNFKMTSS